MKQRIDIKNNRALILLAAFALSLLCSLTAFTLNDVGFFGAKSILISDMDSQYIQFFTAYRDGRVGIFNPYTGLGYSFLGIFANGLASPFNLLLFLFPLSRIDDAIFFVMVIKAALSAVSFSLLLFYEKPKSLWSAVPFAVLYSNMSYVFFYFVNQFWFDALIWLPLIILGVQRLLDKKGCALLIFSLSIMFWSNFYVSYMCGIFTALFAVCLCIQRRPPFKEAAAGILKIAGCAAASAGIAAPMLFPAISGSLAAQLTENTGGYGRFNFTLSMLLKKFMVGRCDGIGNFCAPTFFCGAAVVILALCFLFCKRYRLAERLAGFGLLVFLFVCTFLPQLDIIWHGFAYPNAFAYRYAFVISFLLVYLAFRTYNALNDVPPAPIIVFFAVPVFLLVFYGRMIEAVLPEIVIATAISYAVFAAYLLLKRAGRLRGALISALFTAAVCLEAAAGGAIIVWMMDYLYALPEKSATEEYTQTAEKLLEVREDGYYRTEMTDTPYLDEGARFGYYGVSQFASLFDHGVQDMFNDLGWDGAFKYYCYKPNSLFVDSFFGLRYVVSKTPVEYMTVVSERDGLLLNENKYALPLGFAVSRGILTFEMDGNADDNIEALRAACGYADKSEREALAALAEHPLKVTSFTQSELAGKIELPEDNVLLLTIPADGGLAVYADGQKVETTRVVGALTAIELPAGAHEITVRFRCAPFGAGLAVSGVSLLALAAAALIKKKRTT